MDKTSVKQHWRIIKTAMQTIIDLLKSSGCLGFIDKGGSDALEQIKMRQPDGFALLNSDAAENLLNNYRERMKLIYEQILVTEVRKKLEKLDPVGLMLGRMNPEPVEKAAQELMTETNGQLEDYLDVKYPLLAGYKNQIRKNYIDCFSDFLQAFDLKKKELSEKLLEGKSINSIIHLSTGGADIHRNGRCVIGVKTNAGTVYYKPHDCGLDVLYHKIVEKWFSDCTIAADVVEGNNRFAFVSCLRHEPVSCEKDFAAYYYHFGILAALFHGLGSNDMHMENIISWGDKPAAVDMETILGTAIRADKDNGNIEQLPAQQIVADSLMRTCLLPMRAYKGPIFSPMYTFSNDAKCLPEYEGQFRTVEGYEEEFIRGFKEGYERMLNHRNEIVKLIHEYQHTTVRCLLRNTSFYYLIRQMLFRPENLSDEDSKKTVYEKLCSPYTMYGMEPDQEITQYEWRCMLKGDIPYYCTTVAGTHLCGEDPEQIVKKEYYQTSVGQSAERFLSRLSPEEEVFEEELLRFMFSHAPTDENKETDPEPVAEEAVSEERLIKETAEIYNCLKHDAIHCIDDDLLWISIAESLDVTEAFGNTAMAGNVGMFAARIASSGKFPELQEEAAMLAEKMCHQIIQLLDRIVTVDIKEDNFVKIIPSGLYTGLGSVILACHEMEKSGISGAAGLTERIIKFGLRYKLYGYSKQNAALGNAGLIIALSALPVTEDVMEITAAAAENILEKELPDRADLPYGCAGIGDALAAAFKICGDKRYQDRAYEAFQKVLDDYKPELSGWPDGNAKLKWMADKGPHEAGIYLAAAYAKEKLDTDQEKADPLLDRICTLASESMMNEGTILHTDCLDQGNALTVLALMKAGYRNRSEQILSAMLKRKEQKGCFTVTPNGIRSSFDTSYYMGTTGISYVLMKWLNI